MDVLARHLEHVTIADPSTDLLHLPTLAEVLDTVPGPRSRRGRRYRLTPLLALSLLAVLGGATSLVKITRFIAGYDPDLRARVGLPGTVQLAASTLDGCSLAWTVTPSTPPPAAIWPRSPREDGVDRIP
ncbi:transposase family protein, partial [Nonomuraea sp. bgisy094]